MEKSTDNREFVISRTFNAPKQLLFEVLTQPEHLMHWWGPKGYNMQTAKLDLRPGGMFHYSMATDTGTEMWGRFIYREIDPHDRLVFVNSFSDPSGAITRHPMAPDWPLEMLNELTLVEDNGRTTMTLRGRPINATAAEANVYHNNYPSMQGGFNATWDQLDRYLIELGQTANIA